MAALIQIQLPALVLLILVTTIVVSVSSFSSTLTTTFPFSTARTLLRTENKKILAADDAASSTSIRASSSSSTEADEELRARTNTQTILDFIAAPQVNNVSIASTASVFLTGLTKQESIVLGQVVKEAIAHTELFDDDDKMLSTLTITTADSNSINRTDDGTPVGTLGRVLLLRIRTTTALDQEESIELLRLTIMEQIDYLIYETQELSQPVLVSIIINDNNNDNEDENKNKNEDNLLLVNEIIENEIQLYGLREPIYHYSYQNKNKEKNKSNSTSNSSNDEDGITMTNMFTPTIHIEIDGANTTTQITVVDVDADADSENETTTTFWDTSSVVVFDNLVNDDLRKRLLDIVVNNGNGDSNNENENDSCWNDIDHGPDPSRWIRGGLQDVPDHNDTNNNSTTTEGTSSCWGLRPEIIEDLISTAPNQQHDAIHELESLLTELWEPEYVVCRMPEAVYGDSVSPITANAPVADEYDDPLMYQYHIDGDPMQCPPSPWTDVYGRYPNRARGKPRFVSCLIYLNDIWETCEENNIITTSTKRNKKKKTNSNDDDCWGAPTQFYDPPTDSSYHVFPRPGRVVILDQDVQHTIVPPNPNTGAKNRPRYSMVWKLILHPKQSNNNHLNRHDMNLDCTNSFNNNNHNNTNARHPWPESLLFGSAAAGAVAAQ